MMTKLFAWSASLSRRLLNSGHLLHFLCCTICTMHLLQIFRPKLPIIEPQLQLFPFLATDCHYHCSNLSYSLILLHLCNYTCKYHHQIHQMQELINRQIVFKMKLFDVIGFCTWWKSWWCHWWWWCQTQITLPAASSIIERWGWLWFGRECARLPGDQTLAQLIVQCFETYYVQCNVKLIVQCFEIYHIEYDQTLAQLIVQCPRMYNVQCAIW